MVNLKIRRAIRRASNCRYAHIVQHGIMNIRILQLFLALGCQHDLLAANAYTYYFMYTSLPVAYSRLHVLFTPQVYTRSPVLRSLEYRYGDFTIISPTIFNFRQTHFFQRSLEFPCLGQDMLFVFIQGVLFLKL